MKAVLLSIQPKWCELIAYSKKTVEVRKTKPKLKTPFKCYIYCTQGDSLNYLKTPFFSNCNKFWVDNKAFGANVGRANGKVIGEFVCDIVLDFSLDPYGHNSYFISDDDFESTCFTLFEEFWNYGKGKTLYGWHISDLKLYDEPKALNEFYHTCKQPNGTDCSKCRDKVEQTCWSFTKPPQSWCYTEI